MNGMSSDVHTILENNKAAGFAYRLFTLLEKLGVESATYTHSEDVHDYVERQLIIASWKLQK